MLEYYEARADEYDDWYFGRGLSSGDDRAAWLEEALRIAGILASLAPARTLDIGCGTGFLTKFLHGEVTGLDASEAMLRHARRRAPHASFIKGDALALPFASGVFERVVVGNFYGLLEDPHRLSLLSEARRVGRELVFIDAVRQEGVRDASWQERALKDGSRWQVYKRYFDPESLANEIGEGTVLFAGKWLAVVRAESP